MFSLILGALPARADDPQVCTVTYDNTVNPADDETDTHFYGSLDYALQYFNTATKSESRCRKEIKFDTAGSQIHIYETIHLFRDGDNEFTFGGDDKIKLIVHDLGVDEDGNPNPVFLIDNKDYDGNTTDAIRNLNFKNIRVVSNNSNNRNTRGTVFKCKNSVGDSTSAVNINFDGISIETQPFRPALHLDNCDNVLTSSFDVTITAVDPGYTSDDGVINIPEGRIAPVILVENQSTGFDFNGTLSQLVGHGIVIKENSDNFNLDGVTLGYDPTATYGSDADDISTTTAIGLQIDNSSGTLGTSTDTTIYNNNGHGIYFTDIDSGDIEIGTSILLFNPGDDNNGNAVTIIDSNGLFLSDIEIAFYGLNGIVIEGNSFSNTISGSGAVDDNDVNIHENGKQATHGVTETDGHGVKIVQTASGNPYNNTVENSSIVAHTNCGIYFDTTGKNIVSSNNLYVNNECGMRSVDGGEIDTMEDVEITIIATSSGTVLLDMKNSAFLGEAAYKVELHKITRDGASIGDGSSYLGEAYADNENHGTFIQDGFSASPEYLFFALVTDADGNVLGIWHGNAYQETTDLDDGCYRDQETGKKYRIVSNVEDPTDTDLDGLSDIFEDDGGDNPENANNCQVDSGETSYLDADTDNDGISDYLEVLELETDPLDADSDDDGLLDGEENPNHDTVLDPGETDPLLEDTDDDGLLDPLEIKYGTDPQEPDTDGDTEKDGTDLCPLINSNEASCYYDFCIPDDEYLSGSVSDGAGGENAAGESCQDSDDDGICDDDEDKNNNCQLDAGELDPRTKDTDDDGIEDGIEDKNQDGNYDPDEGETDPTDNDTDDDGIEDGIEDENGNGYVDDETETDPRDPDTDGDGIDDGEEDFDNRGVTDPGETNAAKYDTDSDGLSDSEDPCPFNIDQNCVVYYHNGSGIIVGYENHDADGDGLSDAAEDYDGNGQNSINEPDPLDPDSDDDGLTDYQEVECTNSNPNNADSDADGMSDYEEVEAAIVQGFDCVNLQNLSIDGVSNLNQKDGCSLNRNLATNGSNMPIMGIVGAFGMLLGLLRIRRERKIS